VIKLQESAENLSDLVERQEGNIRSSVKIKGKRREEKDIQKNPDITN